MALPPPVLSRDQTKRVRSILGLDASRRITNGMAAPLGFRSAHDMQVHVWGVDSLSPLALLRQSRIDGRTDVTIAQLQQDAAVRSSVRTRALSTLPRLLPSRVDVTAQRQPDHVAVGTVYTASLKIVMDITFKTGDGREISKTNLERWHGENLVGDEAQLQQQADDTAKEYMEAEVGQSGVVSAHLVRWSLENATRYDNHVAADLTHIMMTNVHWVVIDGVPPTTYNRNPGECVMDALLEMYKAPECRMKRVLADTAAVYRLFEGSYHNRNKTAPMWYYRPDYSSKRDGVCAADLQAFCDKYGISMYGMDGNGVVIYHKVQPRENNHCHRPPLVFRIDGDHLYLDVARTNWAVRCMAAGANGDYTSRSLLPPDYTVTVGAQDRGEDAPTAIGGAEVVAEEEVSGLDWMAAYVRENGVKPDGRNVLVHDDRVASVKVGGKIYMFGQRVADAMRVCANMGRVYNGETLAGMVFEVITEVFGRNGLPRAYANPDVRDVLCAEGCKGHAQCGQTGESWADREVVAYDINKCHDSILHSPFDEWYLPGPHDHVRRFAPCRDPPTAPGLYFVNAPSTTALFRRGTSWYSRVAVREALDSGVPFTYSAFLPCSTVLPRSFFRALVERFLVVAGGDLNICKTMICLFSGYLGKDEMKRTWPYVGSCIPLHSSPPQVR